MSDNKRIFRFRREAERCLCKAATARSYEMETLWMSVVEDYRYLIDIELREQERGTLEWNARAGARTRFVPAS